MHVPGAPIGAVVDGQVFVANCEQLAALVDVSAQGCATNPERFMNEVNRSESRRFETYTIGNPPPDRPVGQMIARVDSDSQARALQANANAMFGPSSVLGWEYLGPNPITGWISPLGAAAVGLFGVAVALLIANTIRFPSQSDQSLVWLAVGSNPPRSIALGPSFRGVIRCAARKRIRHHRSKCGNTRRNHPTGPCLAGHHSDHLRDRNFGHRRNIPLGPCQEAVGRTHPVQREPLDTRRIVESPYGACPGLCGVRVGWICP